MSHAEIDKETCRAKRKERKKENQRKKKKIKGRVLKKVKIGWCFRDLGKKNLPFFSVRVQFITLFLYGFFSSFSRGSVEADKSGR